MSPSSRAGRRSAPKGNRSRHKAYRTRSTSKAIALTLVSALFPGSGFVMGGRTKLGVFVMTLTAGLVGLVALMVLTRRNQVIQLFVDPSQLLIATGVLLALALGWIGVIVSSHKLLRPVGISGLGRAVGAAFVGLLCFAIAVPTAVAAQNVMAQRDLVGSVFASESNSKSATRPKIQNKKDPWAKTPRLNILLLGADDGAGRTGTRTDTVMVASIDTKTGNTSLMSLSRNWMRMPFPADSPLHKKFPDGWWDPSLGNVEQPAYYLDAMYDTIPKEYPNILGPSDNQGADVLKVAVGAAMGLDISYYMQVNLKGFQSIVDALGGITVNINYKVPIGGDYGTGPGAGKAKLPSSYLQPGPNQKLNGFNALWFARGRYGLSDPSRQERQRCTIHAIVNSANPANLATKYKEIAAASKQLLRTDIPQEILPAFIELGIKVKTAKVSNVDLDRSKNFPTGKNPDYQAMRDIVAKAIRPKPQSVATSPTASTTKRPTGKTTAVTPTPGSTQDLTDACAYHPTTAPVG
ncbi:MAG: polyisoprenyl-teichoic acid--peptidoglycan teichoic acid transferase [Kribbellaceae bacterium]|nr:polyisoprenyl-teichoic acid--peptidoglycan teichoic acid transferase [Kribbellaceae bacterium]